MQDRLWGTALQGREILRKKTEERSWKQAWNMFAVLLSAHLVSQRHTHLCPAELLALGRLSVSLQYFFSSCMWGFCCTGDFWGTQALLQQPHGAVDSSRVYLSTFFLNKARPFLKKNKQTKTHYFCYCILGPVMLSFAIPPQQSYHRVLRTKLCMEFPFREMIWLRIVCMGVYPSPIM